MSTTQATPATLLLSKKQAMLTNEAGTLIGASWYVAADKSIAIKERIAEAHEEAGEAWSILNNAWVKP